MAEVNFEDLKPNSNKYKSQLASKSQPGQKTKLKSIVSQDAVVSTKKSLGKKFTETFIEEDVADVKEYFFFDVLIPGIKNTILDCMEMIFFGGGGSRRSSSGRRSSRSDDHYSYSARYKYKSAEKKSSRRDDDEDDRNLDYRDIILLNRDDAIDVVDQMRGRIHEYGSASIADLFDLIGKTGKYTDNNWGWTREADIDYSRVSRGYLIDVADAKLLD